MYPPGGGGGGGNINGGVPLRSLNNKPTSQGDLSLKGVVSVGNKHHSLTDIENKSSGSLDGHIVGQQSGSTTAGVQSAGHTSTMSAPSTTGVVSSAGKNAKSTFQDPDLSFLEQITRMQSKRLDDQRCSLKPPSSSSLQSGGKNQTKSSGKSASGANGVGSGGSTIPNEDFFDLIIKSQRSR